MSLLIAIASTFGLFVVSLFILHVVSSTYLLRSEPARFVAGNPGEFEWHIVVGALNEAAVLDETVRRLLEFSPAHVWLINDASDDATPAIAASWAETNNRVTVVTRQRPGARTGKGDVLNAAYLAITDRRATEDPDELTSAMRTIVGVGDADGVLDPKTFAVLSGPHCFADPSVGAVQQDVWMRNADDATPLPGRGRFRNYLGATLLRLQDLEFRASIAAIQHTRHHTSSVAMGGNGQWTRLAALDDIVLLDASRWDSHRRQPRAARPGPWHGGLLEDFELGLHLLMTGWVTRFTPGCYVAQEALPSLSRYLRQRTRWCQGSMQCMRYLPDLWRSAFIGPWALLELCYYLMQPWLWILATFLFPIPLIDAARAFVQGPADWASWVRHDGGWTGLSCFGGPQSCRSRRGPSPTGPYAAIPKGSSSLDVVHSTTGLRTSCSSTCRTSLRGGLSSDSSDATTVGPRRRGLTNSWVEAVPNLSKRQPRSANPPGENEGCEERIVSSTFRARTDRQPCPADRPRLRCLNHSAQTSTHPSSHPA